MRETTATGVPSEELFERLPPSTAPTLALALIWSREEPGRVGEVALVPRRRGATWILGRETDGADRLSFTRQRPGRNQETGQLRASRVSRDHLLLRADRELLEVRNGGRLDVYVNGVAAPAARLTAGDLVEIDRELLLLVVARPDVLAGVSEEPCPFGHADDDGLVGESPALWALRQKIAFCAATREHVLVSGPSGAGKERVAQAIARRSSPRPLVSRNAATFPESLIDAELFGNLRDYPNPGMAARPGLVGEADGSTLFLDEIGELPQAMQAHLLRVLDSGEYQRLGEARSRIARFRLIGATNRPLEAMKHDLLARLTQRIELPGLEERREDVPLVAAHLLGRIAQENPSLFPDGVPHLHPRLARALVQHPYQTHVRELHRLLWSALEAWAAGGRPRYLDGTPELEPRPTVPRPAAPAEPIDRDGILRAYRSAGGVQTRVIELLGLRDRFQLLRLEKKFAITAEDRAAALATSAEAE